MNESDGMKRVKKKTIKIDEFSEEKKRIKSYWISYCYGLSPEENT